MSFFKQNLYRYCKIWYISNKRNDKHVSIAGYLRSLTPISVFSCTFVLFWFKPSETRGVIIKSSRRFSIFITVYYPYVDIRRHHFVWTMLREAVLPKLFAQIIRKCHGRSQKPLYQPSPMSLSELLSFGELSIIVPAVKELDNLHVGTSTLSAEVCTSYRFALYALCCKSTTVTLLSYYSCQCQVALCLSMMYKHL